MRNLNNQESRQLLETQPSQDKGRGFSKSIPRWLEKFDKENDFLSRNLLSSSEYITEE